jgi:hypothetical protein
MYGVFIEAHLFSYVCFFFSRLKRSKAAKADNGNTTAKQQESKPLSDLPPA